MQKIHEIDDQVFVRNIAALYQDATRLGTDLASRNWYTIARNDCMALAEEMSVTLDVVVGVVAALSPQINWKRNLVAASRLMRGLRCEGYGANIDKSIRIFKGETPLDVLGGNKVRSFYRNIISSGEDCSCVTVDRWAVKAAMGKDAWNEQQSAPTNKQYKRVEDAYKQVSCDLNIPATELQAVTWVHIKEQVRHPVDDRQMILGLQE